jgi:hypothetical protein
MEVLLSTRPVGDPPDAHLPEHGLKRPLMIALGVWPNDPVRAHHHLEALLADRAQQKRILIQPAQQLPALGPQPLLQLPVRERSRLLAAHPLPQRAIPLIRASERLLAIRRQDGIG